MTVYYADSSVLTKVHIPEAGTEWVRTITDHTSGNIIFTAYVTQIEGMSAFNRRLREGTLESAEYQLIVEDWLKRCSATYQLASMSPQIVLVCRRLLETYPLRAYDAVQLAAAVISNQTFTTVGGPPLIFLASDKRLLDAAKGEGFVVDDPNNHP